MLAFQHLMNSPFSILNIVLFSGFVMGVLNLNGCAYQFGSGHRSLPGFHEEVAIPVFKNSTQQVGVESAFTNSLTREFSRSKVARVVGRNEAPVVIEGNIKSIIFRHGGKIDASDDAQVKIPDNTVLTSEYRVMVEANVSLVRQSDRKTLWTGDVRSERAYTAPQLGLPGMNSANALYNHSARMEVIQVLAQEMMNEIHDRMTENF